MSSVIFVIAVVIITANFIIVYILLKNGKINLSIKKNIPGSFAVYPSPADKYAFVALELLLDDVHASLTTEIIDYSGRNIYSKTYQDANGSMVYQLPIEGLNNGVYSVVVRIGNASMVRKLVIARKASA